MAQDASAAASDHLAEIPNPDLSALGLRHSHRLLFCCVAQPQRVLRSPRYIRQNSLTQLTTAAHSRWVDSPCLFFLCRLFFIHKESRTPGEPPPLRDGVGTGCLEVRRQAARVNTTVIEDHGLLQRAFQTLSQLSFSHSLSMAASWPSLGFHKVVALMIALAIHF